MSSYRFHCDRRMTSSGHLAPLVGKRFLAGGLRVYFAWIHALFTSVLLTHKIMIMLCICVGVSLALCGLLVIVCYHQKKENEENSG